MPLPTKALSQHDRIELLRQEATKRRRRLGKNDQYPIVIDVDNYHYKTHYKWMEKGLNQSYIYLRVDPNLDPNDK